MFQENVMPFEVKSKFLHQALLQVSLPVIMPEKAQVKARTYLGGKLSFFSPPADSSHSCLMAHSCIRTLQHGNEL
jgi:hypothetical protein